MLDSKLIVPYLLLIPQVRSRIVFDSDIRHLKLMSKAFDRCHSTLILLIEFLHLSQSSKDLVSLLPSMRSFLTGM